MWLSRLPKLFRACFAIVVLLAVGACTVEPLNSSSSIGSSSTSQSTKDILASTSVDPVNSRVGQQVRNNLLFALNGGELQPGGRYTVNIKVVSASRALSIQSSSLSPTSAQVAVAVDYKLVDSSSGKTVDSGKRRSLAGYDRTPQSFANERAERDAQNRAAKEVAQQIRLAIAQSISNL